MTYKEARNQLKEGKAIARKEWGEKKYVRAIDGRSFILDWNTGLRPEGVHYHSFAPMAEELAADDWQVVTPPGEKGKARQAADAERRRIRREQIEFKNAKYEAAALRRAGKPVPKEIEELAKK